MNMRGSHEGGAGMGMRERNVVNVPSYSELLTLSGLSRSQFSEKNYAEYVDSVERRIGFLKEQATGLEGRFRQIEPELKHGSRLLRAHAELVRTFLTSVSDGIDGMTKQTDLFPNQDRWFLNEERIDSLSGELRELKFAMANLYAMGGYQAVGSASSRDSQIGAGQIVQPDLYTEYARYDLSAKEAEGYYNDMIEAPEGVESTTLLFGSGMAAVTTVLSVAKRENQKDRFLFGSQLYFENKNQSEQLRAEMGRRRFGTFDERSNDDLRAKLAGDPAVIFTEPVGNSRNLPTVNVEEILTSPTSHERRLVVLDITLLGPTFDAKRALASMDEHTDVLLINSLQKLYQEGDGVAPAGTVTVLSRNQKVREALTSELRAFRGMLGTNVTMHSVALLQRTNPEAVRSGAEQIGKNVSLLAAELRQGSPSLVEHVATGDILPDGSSQTPLLYLHLKQPVAWRVIEAAIDRARDANVQLTNGASFGFKTTRLSVIAGDQTAIRICPGMENPRQIRLLADALCAALDDVANAEEAPEEKIPAA